MKSVIAPVLLALSLAASTFAQAVSEGIAPTAAAPAGCQPTYTGNFTLGTVSIASKKRADDTANAAVTVILHDGILHDSLGRTGSIVANHQFQFDGPPQAGSIYTGGWSVCANDSLAMGASTVFYKCLSGDFYNLYDISVGDQCTPCNIVITPVDQPSSSSSSSMASSTMSSSKSASSSTSVITTASSILLPSATSTASGNLTISLSSPSVSSGTMTVTTSATGTAASKAASSSSTGGAVPTRAARAEAFGAVVGILGAVFIL